MTVFSSLKTWLTKADARVEGGRIQGPLARVSTPQAGWLPMSWPLNFWQLGGNVQPDPTNSIVDACVWAYIRAIAQLPGYHKYEADDGAVENVTTSALSRLLRWPNTYQTRSDFLTNVIRSLLYQGNSYSLAVRNSRNEVVELHWLRPETCRVTEIAVKDEPLKEIFYAIGNSNQLINWAAIEGGKLTLVPQRDMFHVKLATPFHPLIGESWLTSLAFELMNRGAITTSMSNFFGNASRPSGVITSDMQLTKQQVDELRERWNAQSTGLNQGGVPILTHGLKWQPMGVSNQDAQVIDALKLSDEAVCSVFGVPAMLVGLDRNTANRTFSSTEALMNYWLANGLGYLLDHIETQMDQFLGLPANEWTEFDTDALLRTDLQVRIEALARGVQGGIYSPNEARDREGLASVKAGDEPRVQQQVVPLSFATKPVAAPKPAAPLVPPMPGAPSPAGKQPAPAAKSKSVMDYELALDRAA